MTIQPLNRAYLSQPRAYHRTLLLSILLSNSQRNRLLKFLLRRRANQLMEPAGKDSQERSRRVLSSWVKFLIPLFPQLSKPYVEC